MNEREIFLEALEKGFPDERCSFLDRICGDDAQLRSRLELLLKSHEQAVSLLDHPVLGDGPTLSMTGLTDGPESETSEDDRMVFDFLKPSEEPDSLGRLGQYEIQEVVGRGGMGIVFRAHDTKLSRVVAVKVLAPELAANATARKRFLREARAAAAVSHDHVVTIYAVEENEPSKDSQCATHRDPPYLVMEFIDGLTLEQKIDRDGHLELKEILRIGRQIAAGLAAAHQQGLIHRDIKPSNILLQNSVQRVEITDFGLARASDDMGITRTGEVTGTPQYMSPEQAQGHTVDARSDLFSLGSVLYAMCTGRSPFRAETTIASLRRVCDDTPRPIREVNPDVPEWLAAITDRLLEKDPDDRFQSAEEACRVLGQCLAHVQDPAVNQLPVSLAAMGAAKRKTSPAKPAASAPRRHRWAVAAALLVGVLALATLSEATGVTNLAATVIRIATGEGTLVIEVDDPTVQISLDGEELSITGAGIQELTLRPGKYQFQAIKDGQPVQTELVSIARGGRQVVTVRLESPTITTQVKGKSTDYTSVPEGAITEVRRFEGGHARRIDCVAVSADGRRLLSGSADATVRLWDVATGEEIRPLLGHTTGINCVAFSPDGRHALSGGIDAVRLWDVETGKEIRVFEEARVAGVAFSPDGRLALSGKAAYGVHKGDVTLRLWDVQSGRQLRSLAGQNDIVWSVAFSPDGRWALAGGAGFSGSNRIGLWDTETGELVRHFMGDATTVTSVAFSPDGRRVVSGHSGFVIEDGKCVLDPHSGLVRLWDVETGREIRRFKGHSGPVRSVAFSPDGWYVLSGSGGQHDSYGKFIKTDDNTIRLWDAESGRELWRADLDQRVAGVAFLPDGRHVVSAGGDYDGGPDLRLWQLPKSLWPVKQLTEIRRFEGHTRMITSVAVSPDGRFLLSGDESGVVLRSNLETGKAEKAFAGHEISVYDLSFSPDGTAYSCSNDQTARRWDVESGEEIRRYVGHTGWVRALAVSPDGKHLLTGSTWYPRAHQGIPRDNSLRLWDVETGKEIRRFEDVAVATGDVAFAPDGQSIVAGGDNSMLGLWDVETGKCIRWFTAPTNVLSVAFSPDGAQVASSHFGGLKDGKWFDPEHSVIILWDVKTGREIRRLRGHTAEIKSIAFSRDGRFLASAAGGAYGTGGWHDAQENTVRIWDAATGEELDRADLGTSVQSVAFTPDGRYLVTGGGHPPAAPGHADLRLWKLPQSVWPKDVTDVSPKPAIAARPSLDETVNAEPSLGIGSPAPPLSVAQWISGQSIDGFHPGQVYVVEFWATWCPPCRTSMPHLSQLQQQYGDEVKFVGVTREAEETVKEFLAKEQSPGKTWAEVVQYRLAIDSGGATHEAYMKAAGQSGIPTAFIVGRDAVVEWIGHPMSMEEPLGKIVAGNWDRQAAIVQFQQQQKLKRLSRELSAKLRAEEWDDALEMLDQLEEESGKSDQLTRMRLSALQKAGRSEEASQLQVEMVEQAWESPMALNAIAWGIARSKGEGDLDLAFKAAQRASELQNHQDPATLDTLARIYYEKGQLDKAIEWQKKAVQLNQGNRSIDATLKKYEAEKALPSDDSRAPAEGDPANGDER